MLLQETLIQKLIMPKLKSHILENLHLYQKKFDRIIKCPSQYIASFYYDLLKANLPYSKETHIVKTHCDYQNKLSQIQKEILKTYTKSACIIYVTKEIDYTPVGFITIELPSLKDLLPGVPKIIVEIINFYQFEDLYMDLFNTQVILELKIILSKYDLETLIHCIVQYIETAGVLGEEHLAMQTLRGYSRKSISSPKTQIMSQDKLIEEFL